MLDLGSRRWKLNNHVKMGGSQSASQSVRGTISEVTPHTHWDTLGTLDTPGHSRHHQPAEL